MPKLDPRLSHAEIRARILGGNATPSRSSRDRTGLVAAGPNVIAEAGGAEGQPANPRYRSGPGWTESMRAWGGVEHHPGKQDTPDIGRKRVFTY
jgi:hypothetical protein